MSNGGRKKKKKGVVRVLLAPKKVEEKEEGKDGGDQRCGLTPVTFDFWTKTTPWKAPEKRIVDDSEVEEEQYLLWTKVINQAVEERESELPTLSSEPSLRQAAAIMAQEFAIHLTNTVKGRSTTQAIMIEEQEQEEKLDPQRIHTTSIKSDKEVEEEEANVITPTDKRPIRSRKTVVQIPLKDRQVPTPIKTACLQCRSEHRKCTEERPCPRCVKKGIECKWPRMAEIDEEPSLLTTERTELPREQ
ncbi:hypothetical protein PROFUN_10730 [Planoprotostelium fungivorum]|uniref:Zn(2)-C6 fungal-type domain-containing protein n=1 Tax=Planoprotostelium fungivorum TaxID=1890364 RepID=A0A2P6N7X5_9EUKA|nr:hypothetical protein PROFUN_10730 [Planoprotostelium fungivorum]